MIAGPGGTQAQIERIRGDLGLDRPLGSQYLAFLRDLFRGDLGPSLAFGRPVTAVIAPRIGPTLALMATSLGLTVVVAVPAGLVAAVRPLGVASQAIMAATLIPSIPLALLYNSFLDRFIKGFTGGAFR